MEENVTNTDITIDNEYFDKYFNLQSDIKNNLDTVIDNQNKLIEQQNTIIEQQKQLIDYFVPTEEEIKEQQQKEKEEQEILNQEKQKSESEQQEFYTNIKTISENSNTETQTQVLQDVSTLMQANMVGIGLLIGIVCISLLARFFKR